VSKVHISGSIEKLLHTAEKMELKKLCVDKERGMREFTEAGLKRGIFAFSGIYLCCNFSWFVFILAPGTDFYPMK